MDSLSLRTFNVHHCLGRGGFGEVYRATMVTPGGLTSDVAMKVLRRDVDPAGQAVERLRDEGKLLARLDHPTILRVHELTILEGRVALITEYIPGQDLEGLFKGAERLPPRPLLEAIASVAHALHSAFNARLDDGKPLELVHRDIKPGNIRVSQHGEVKLLDFGIARTDKVQRQARTQTDMLVGSPAYMAPERFDMNATDPSSDVFALGATLYEGLAGHRFFGKLDLPKIAGLAMNSDRFATYLDAQIQALPNELGADIETLLREMLQDDPTLRPSAKDVSERCEDLAEALGGPTLKRWSRARDWPDEPLEMAELSSRTLTEGTMEQSVILAKPDVPAPSSRGMGPWMIMAAAGSLFAAVLGVTTLAAGVWWTNLPGGQLPSTEEIPATDEEPNEREEAGATPANPSTAPQPEPAPQPTAVAPRPAPRPVAPAPEPQPVATPEPQPDPIPEPSPAPEPEPTPAPAPTVVPPTTVFVDGDVQVRAIGSGGVVGLPGTLPPGTWDIEAAFVPGSYTSGAAQLVVDDQGGTYTLTCSARFRKCELR